mmetsp:Transcript_5419/g.15078  ORF Transcript_5419/g.15078 Transcript_5419/m.15078 type:complete len:168 (-) Transcript_5419:55-558(-)|eukprot:CAMPEP_0117683572 /NCGR_PEP_ID=MMETSP0804-20121206/20491_1 /TAXON_ID=1074897 /ORGANISM="Tetraselmis astigmatica, Strain CCMP880" /LENGTH=167 /DNA_ID=CAMNT_0005494213 /DNA_START=171 /DNA_END=674 /DNA_ORIENTATION=+
MASILSGCWDCLALLVSPATQAIWEDVAPKYGPGVAGALFGAGWWFFLDAIIYSSQTHQSTIPGVLCVPGIIATVALVMINMIRREDIRGQGSFDEGNLCRSKFWLFLSYCVSFSAVVVAVWLLIGHSGDNSEWSCVAALFQVCFILGSALTFFLSRSAGEDTYSYY